MTLIEVRPVVMAGGSGTGLWPLSRSQHPKQFLALHGERSLFQQAALRVARLRGPDLSIGASCIVCNDDHRFLVLDQFRELDLPTATLLLESTGRNTAPAIHAAAGGKPISDADDLFEALGTLKRPFDLVLVRGSEERTVSVG